MRSVGTKIPSAICLHHADLELAQEPCLAVSGLGKRGMHALGKKNTACKALAECISVHASQLHWHFNAWLVIGMAWHSSKHTLFHVKI